MPLTDLMIRKAKPKDRDYRLTDERGLYLLVKTTGQKWWRQDFPLAGKRRTMSFGTYPDVGLPDARSERDKIRKLVARGVDPVQERRSTNGSAVAENPASFEALAGRWLESQRAEWAPKYFEKVKARLEAEVFPHIGSRDIRTIGPVDMLDLIRKVESRGALDCSTRIKGNCGKVFRFAIAEGWDARDPTGDIRDAMKKPPPVTHRAALKPDQMGAFLVRLADNADEHQVTLDAMELTLLTAVRTVETRFADIAEFEDLDGRQPQWRIPKERMKMSRPHIVPLSPQAVSVARRVIGRMRRGQTLLFERGTRSGSISENTMLYALYRMGYRGRATVHGFRGTFSTVANGAVTTNAAGEDVRMWDRDWIEFQLAHVDKDTTRSAYNAAEYLPQRRRLMLWWADWLDQQRDLARLIG